MSFCNALSRRAHIRDLTVCPGRYKCLLFTTGDYREEDGQFVPEWASGIYCYYVVLMAAYVIIVCLLQAGRTLLFLRSDTDT